MTQIDYTWMPAHQLLVHLSTHTVTSRALLELFLGRIARLNPSLNAVVVLDVDSARQRADAADQARLRGEMWGPLHGLPMTIKDTAWFKSAGFRVTLADQSLLKNWGYRVR